MEQIRPGRPEAADAIWSWGTEAPADDTAAVRKRARVRGSLQGSVGIALGSTVALLYSRTLGLTIASLGTLILLCALLSPTALYAALSRLFEWTGHMLSRGVTWITMVILFYGAFLPYGRLFRRGRSDRMERYSEPEAPTYWKTRAPARAGSHERLY